MQQCQWYLSTVSLYGSTYTKITRRHCSKFSVAPLLLMRTSQNSSTVLGTVIPPVASDSVSHRCVGKLPGSYCLSRLNARFLPCVCAFTYLSSSIIFTADTSSSSCCPSLVNQPLLPRVDRLQYLTRGGGAGLRDLLFSRV